MAAGDLHQEPPILTRQLRLGGNLNQALHGWRLRQCGLLAAVAQHDSWRPARRELAHHTKDHEAHTTQGVLPGVVTLQYTRVLPGVVILQYTKALVHL